MMIDYLAGNRLTLLNSGAEYFPALLDAIETAESEIFLESYIYANDEIGRRVGEALCRAVARGVVANVIVDGFGARNFATDFLPQLTAAGVRAMLYRPELGSFLGRFRLRRHRLRRLHRKLAVIDARLAFIGGINIIDDDNTPPELHPRYDYAVRIEGPLLGPIHRAARHMWEIVAWVNFKHRYRLPSTITPNRAQQGRQRAALLIRDNIRHRNDILHAYLGVIAAAREEILIANAYFLPGVRFVRALQAAARRGVRITVLLQGKTDHHLLRFATQALYSLLLEQGVRIFEYEKSFLHAKVAVIDGEWATVGSSNIDPFSLLLAKEANLAVLDRVFAGQLHASIEAAMLVGAKEKRSEDLTSQPWHSRLLRWLSYGIVRALVGITGYGQKHWRADEETAAIDPEEE